MCWEEKKKEDGLGWVRFGLRGDMQMQVDQQVEHIFIIIHNNNIYNYKMWTFLLIKLWTCDD